ncbi:DNA/RNA helicase domain-containing protein [uncultured Roseivirga sp.]|uniref:DNA/RNA helicase domain-containing protein n=1 Tax=uncultured Roseivirga sp. TaxID=543088 RepID=UPI0030D75CD4
MFSSSVNVKSYPFNKADIGLISNDAFARGSFPIIYILYNTETMMAYVGESTNAISRMSSHLTHPEKQQLKWVYIISDESFNKSAALDIESNLIQYMTAAGDFKLLNGNGGVSSHNYYQKSEYFKVFKEVWSKLTFENIRMKDLLELENSDIFKYSPYKSLSPDQYDSILEVFKNYSSGTVKKIFVNGSAGTGKTILAIYLIKLLTTLGQYELHDLDIEDETLLLELNTFKQKHPNKLRIGLVVPMTSLRSTLQQVFKSLHGLSSSMVIGPTDVVKKEYDFLIVDEAHRLTRRKSIMGYGVFDNVNKKLGLYHTEKIDGKDVQSAEKNGTQLDWIIKSSKYQLFFYDSEQSIKPADVRKEHFDALKNKADSTQIQLVSQMRSKGDNDYMSFVDNLLNGKLDKNSPHFSNPNYELAIFKDIAYMMDRLQEKEYEFGLCRSMSGYSWPWVSKNNKSKPDAIIDGVKLFWNRESIDWINSTTEVTEMGCIHTVQGYDLNYAAIIFGEEIIYDKQSGKIRVIKSKYHDSKGKQAIENEDELLKYIINIYKTMMYRGIRGTFIYACDKNLQEYFERYIPLDKKDNQLRTLPFAEVKPYVNAVPLVDIYAAAGEFSELQISGENFDWVELPENISTKEGYFVCQIIGESMNKKIQNGSWCLFKENPIGSRQGKIVLAKHYDIQDSDFGAGYTVKSYHSEKNITEDNWSHKTIVLKPLSYDSSFEDIILRGDEINRLKIVGEFITVLDL